DMLAFFGIADAGAPGLLDDLDAMASFRDQGAGQDVVVSLGQGTTLIFEGLGTGSVASFADLVADADTQLILAGAWS
ncbi:MAG: hypothetical protein KDA73_08765, partial [Rhodobacteraceae bacterium]|nr:hypothetical protein [Paracoccaceae bacterium]